MQMMAIEVSSPGETTDSVPVPVVGSPVIVRNREAVIAGVKPFTGGVEGLTHLVQLEYCDGELPAGDNVVWELEAGTGAAEALFPRRLCAQPMDTTRLRSLVRVGRWVTPTISPVSGGDAAEAGGREGLYAPLASSVRPEEYQLVPLVRALEMPRIRLLLADDVGLGKTVEAGLIAAELLVRRRIRKVLVLCPPGLRTQWQEEMKEKFGLDFDIVDRANALKLKGRFGTDANPWARHDRIIASYYYLSQPHVLEQFRSSCDAGARPHLPWDLLIVDEAHNLSPPPRGSESNLTRTLRSVSKWFEHRLFLTATPHDGYRSSFAGLLEILDPINFRRTARLSTPERKSARKHVIRRMKSAVNSSGSTTAFSRRRAVERPVRFSPREIELFEAFREFRDTLVGWGRGPHEQRGIGLSLAVEVLSKRLLSSSSAFASSFSAFLAGLESNRKPDDEEMAAAVISAANPGPEDPGGRWHAAASLVAAWCRTHFPGTAAKVQRIETALENLGLDPRDRRCQVPSIDSRAAELMAWIVEHLNPGAAWREDERVLIFTEYKTTLDALERRFKERFPPERFGAVSGATGDKERARAIGTFCDPQAEIRILLTTDVASEGLNLQRAARYIFHYDIPWNPAVLEQRIGRLDRAGQSRDVVSFHFTSSRTRELKLLATVSCKVDTIRQDLDSMGEVLAGRVSSALGRTRTEKRLLGETPARESAVQRRAEPVVCCRTEAGESVAATAGLEKELLLFPEEKRESIAAALRILAPEADLSGPDDTGCYGFTGLDRHTRGKLEEQFGPHFALQEQWGEPRLPRLILDRSRMRREVIPAVNRDTVFIHAGHPLFRWVLYRLGWSDHKSDAFNRWCIFFHPLPRGMDSALLLFLRCLAANRLRQPVVASVEPLLLPLVRTRFGWSPKGMFGQSSILPQRSGAVSKRELVRSLVRSFLQAGETVSPSQEQIDCAGRMLDSCGDAVKEQTCEYARIRAAALDASLQREKSAEAAAVSRRFEERKQELEVASDIRRIERLRGMEARLQARLSAMGYLFPCLERQALVQVAEVRAELGKLDSHLAKVSELMDTEERWLLDSFIPARYSLAHPLFVSTIALAVILPDRAGSIAGGDHE